MTNDDLNADQNHPESQNPNVDFLKRISDVNYIRRLAISKTQPEWIGPYQVVRLLGAGGMGQVWLAEQSEPVKRQVAVKVVDGHSGSRKIVARFDAERQALALMNHSNVAKIFDAGHTSDNQPYFVMEYVDGLPLTEYCDQKRLSVAQRLSLFELVCAGIQHAHQKGIIHRDLKPGNILVGVENGKPVPKIIDFGLAKAMEAELNRDQSLTQIGQVLGTLKYMSPEQAGLDSSAIDTRSDIFSLGVILFELLTGSTPLTDDASNCDSVISVLEKIRATEAPVPSKRLASEKPDTRSQITQFRQTDTRSLQKLLNRDLDWIVLKALEISAERRYQTVSELAADLRRHRLSEPVAARPPSVSYRLKKFVRKNRTATIAASLVSAALVFGVIGVTWGYFKAENARKDAVAARNAESKRADAEADAKVEAQNANERALRRLKQIRESNLLLSSIFEDLDVFDHDAETEPLEARLAERVKEAARLLQETQQDDMIEVAELKLKLAATLDAFGFDKEAIPILEQAIATFRRRNLAEDDWRILAALNNLASSHLGTQNTDKAIPLLKEVVAKAEKKFGEESRSALKYQSNLAFAYHEAEIYDKAIPIYRKAIPIADRVLGKTHAETLVMKHNLAASLFDSNQFQDAIQLTQKNLEDRKSAFEPGHPSIAICMGNLATYHRNVGNHDAALPFAKDSYELLLSRLGAYHPTTLNAMKRLAGLYGAMGNDKEAIKLREEQIRVLTLRRGDSDRETISAIADTVEVYRKLKESDKARATAEKALSLAKKHLGPKDLLTLAAMQRMAHILLDQGEFERAIKVLEEQYQILESEHGAFHVDTIRNLYDRSNFYSKWRKLPQSISFMEKAVERYTKRLGEKHLLTMRALNRLAILYQSANQLDQAVETFKRVLKLRSDRYGPGHANSLNSNHSLAVTLAMARRFDEALKHFRIGFEQTQADLGSDHATTQFRKLSLGMCLIDSGKLKEGADFLDPIYRQRHKIKKTMTRSDLEWHRRLFWAKVMLKERKAAIAMAHSIAADVNVVEPDSDFFRATTLSGLGQLLVSVEAYEDAKKLLNDSLSTWKQVKNSELKWVPFDSQSLLGEALLGCGKPEEALAQLLEAYEGLKKHRKTINGPGPRKILAAAVTRIIKCYEAMGDDDGVKKWQAELEQIEDEQSKD